MTRAPSLALCVPLALALALTATPAQSQDVFDVETVLRGDGRGLSSEEVVERAVARAPSIAAADAAVSSVSASVQTVWASIIPTVTFGGRYTRLSPIVNDPLVTAPPGADPGPLVAQVDDPEARQLWTSSLAQNQALATSTIPVILDMFVFEAQVQVPVSELFLTLLPRLEAAEAAVDAERSRREIVEATLRMRAREAYYGALRARALVAVSSAQVVDVEEQVRIAQLGYEEGAVRRSDLLGAQALLAGARASRARALAMSGAADAVVRSLLGMGPDERLALGEDLSVALPAQARTPSALVGLAFERRAEVRALRHGVRASRSAQRAAEGARWPALRFAFGAQVSNPNQRYVPQREQFDATWDLSVVLAWSPNQAIAADARASVASADAARLEADLEAFRDALHREVAAAYAEDRAASAQRLQAQAAVEAAEEAYRARQAERAEGEALTSEVLAAQTQLARARLLQVDAAVSARVARARLAFATADGVAPPQ